MAVTINESACVVGGAQSISLSHLITTTASAGNPAYLVLTGLDRNEYAAGATGATGTLAGAGRTLGFSSIGGDARGVGIAFAYQASTGRYYSSAYGYLDQLTYTASASLGDVTSLSLFGMGNAHLAAGYAGNPYALMQADPSGYLGTVTVATEPGFAGAVPAQATPDGIAATAEGFVGEAWNTDGCWVLASTIAAEAGASLPVQSTADMAGQANGEWFVAYNGPAGSAGDWQSLVHAGEMVGFVTAAGTGHITTCVSGSGGTATLVDNITYEDASGTITNAAGDGSASDVTIAAAHAAAQEWAGMQANSVVIYELDTPVVTAQLAGITLAAGADEALGGLFTAADPAGMAVISYQAYDTNPGAALMVNGTAAVASSAGTAVTVGSLDQVTLAAGDAAATGTIHVRAFNGSYWGDWASLGVTVTAPPAVAWTDTATGAQGSGGEAYSGPVSYLRWQYIWAGQDGAAVAANVPGAYLLGGSGNDALSATAGSNVLDGGTGSNFLVGAAGADGGTDTFFLDGRGDAATWDTIVDFHAGDAVTLWGFVQGQGTTDWAGSEGAAGYQGATLDVAFGGGAPSAAVTFAGLDPAAAQAALAFSTGSVGGVPYLYVRYAG